MGKGFLKVNKSLEIFRTRIHNNKKPAKIEA